MGYPTFLDHSPEKNFIGIQRDTLVFFRIEDNDGLNLSTLTTKINGVDAILNGTYQTGYSGVITQEDATPKAVSVVINPDVDFDYGQTVQVTSTIEDLLGTEGNDFYQFVIIPNPDKLAPVVVADPHGGLYNSSQSVVLTATEPSVVIYYTLDGTEPNLGSTVYTGPISISDEGTTTLKFFGYDPAGNHDSVRLEEYTIDTEIPTTTANPVGGNYFSSQKVELEVDDPNATTFFTTNGLLPTTNSTVYTTPIPISDNQQTTLKFFSIDPAGNQEVPKTEIYTIEIAKNNIIVRNIFVKHAYVRNELQITWEDMWPMYTDIIGYNVYRSDFEHGQYSKLNNNLITITQYIDKTLDTEIINEDVSEQFRRTVNISRDVNDDFSESHIDITKWRETDVAQLLFLYYGLIFSDKTGLNQESKLTSKFKLRGDFDIQIDFELQKWTVPVSLISASIFRVKKDDNNYIEISRAKSQSNDVYSSNKITGGNPDLPSTTSTIDSYGKCRITRSGNIITTYFYDNNAGDFVSHATFNSYTEDLYIEIVGKSADVAVEMMWKNFILNSGLPVIIEPLNQLQEYVIQVSKFPIVDSSGTNHPTDEISEVLVTINGQEARIKRLEGKEGCIYLQTDRCYDEVKKEYFTPPVPNEYSTILVTYKTPLHTTKIDLRKNYFYKVTAVTNRDETDLDVIQSEYIKPEKLTYIYEEAIRRNAWLREQGGERVLFYAQKKAGEPCPCTLRDIKRRSHRKSDQDCETCFGSGFVGGFADPIPIIIGNLTSEQRINQTERGLKLQYQVETWTGPFPLISQRDMLIRRNGDRVLVGPVTPVDGPGGVVTQQHFTIEVLDATDVRYTYPVQTLLNQYVEGSHGIDKTGQTVPEISSPAEREDHEGSWDRKDGADEPDRRNKDRESHRNWNVDRQKRGRDIVFDNKTY